MLEKTIFHGVTEVIFEDTNKELKSSSKYEKYNPVGELQDTVQSQGKESFEYARYWHGYLSIIRPLLLIFNITQIRILLTIIFLMLAIILLYLIAKKINIITMIIFLLSLITIEYFYIGVSLQGSFVFLITMILSIIILMKDGKIKNLGLSFFVVGMITNYFDFLTVPLITFGFPMILYFLLKQKEEKIRSKQAILIIIKTGLAWVIGYALTWFTKWVLVDVFCNRNMITSAIQQVLYRSRGNNISLFDGMLKNLHYEKYIIIFLIFVKLNYMIFRKFLVKPKIQKKYLIEDSIPYIIIALLPFIWYLIVGQHSNNHPFFTYRNLLLTIICIPISMLKDKVKYKI
ncbi:MAG: hypothetical protein GX682_03150 [Clostridiaceae bacterium]|nr:hypothetical protein [Clostridiaceae bacterium]